jgi:hypothetical protein
VIDVWDIYEFRESEADCLVNIVPENGDIDVNNAYLWNAIA